MVVCLGTILKFAFVAILSFVSGPKAQTCVGLRSNVSRFRPPSIRTRIALRERHVIQRIHLHGGSVISGTTVRLQPEVEVGLRAMAVKLLQSKSQVTYQSLREFLERQKQEQTRWQETLKALESVANDRVVSGEAVQTWLRSCGAANELPPSKAGQ